MPVKRTKAGAGVTMPPSMPSSCPVDEHQVGIGISEDFQKMRRRLYGGARALRPGRDQSAKTIGNRKHRTRQSKLLCHWPCAVFSPESVVDNAANSALTLRGGSLGGPRSHRPRAPAPAGLQVAAAT